MKRIAIASLATLIVAAILPSAPAMAQEKPSGFTCCNMRYTDDWISDGNYASQPMLGLGQPAQVTDYGRYRVAITVNGKKMRIGNDYSRDQSLEDFAKKWIVKDDPKLKMAKFSPEIREAITQSKVRKGMTKEQVIMSLGHPITSENPDPNSNLWRYWLSSFDEYQISWDSNGRIKEVLAPPTTLSRVIHGNN
jgi:SmpA / OmlA family